MLTIPFTTGEQLKTAFTGLDISIDIKNFGSGLNLAASDIANIIGEETYEVIASYTVGSDISEKKIKALGLLRNAMAPMALIYNIPILQLRISNNAITTYKSSDETTAFRYQLDDLKETLLLMYAASMKDLIDLLNKEVETFTTWGESENKTEQDALLISNYRDFEKVFPINNDASYYLRARTVMAQVTSEQLEPVCGDIAKIKTPEIGEPDKLLLAKLRRALACYTIARTASDWDYYFLPQPIRRAIRDELGREPKADAKEAISNKFKTKGDAIMREIQNTISAAKQDIVTNTEPIEITTIQPSANDKFASII